MAGLKILHLNNDDMADPRISNEAIAAKRKGHRLFYCGRQEHRTLPEAEKIFEKMFWMQVSPRALWGRNVFGPLGRFWYFAPYPRNAIYLEKQIKQVVDVLRPDIIHAHNVFIAYHAKNLGYPMIIDDHELYSMHLKMEYVDEPKAVNPARRAKQIAKNNTKLQLVKNTESILGEKGYPVISVSEPCCKYWETEYGTKHTFTLPNYPNKDYIDFDPEKDFKYAADCKELNSVYLGMDGIPSTSVLRNINSLYDYFNGKYPNTGRLMRIGVVSPVGERIRAYGILPMVDAYRLMGEQGHIGLLPWKHHWYHEYCSPNKAVEYAHCGLLFVTVNTLKFVIDQYAGNCDTFSTYEQMAELLAKYNADRNLLDKRRKQCMNHARTNMIWEKNEHKVMEAYSKA